MRNMKLFALLLALVIVFSCTAVLAEDETICTYTIYNITGETIKELYLVDNVTGEKGENLVGENGLANEANIAIQGENYDGYVKTLLFITESGAESSFDTLHFETVPITLLPKNVIPDDATQEEIDALTSATPISFMVPFISCEYTICNQTGETVKSITFTDKYTGQVEEILDEIYYQTELKDGETTSFVFDAKADETDKDHYEQSLKFVTESGREGEFATLHFETVTINLLSQDAMTGATPISFSMTVDE